MTFSSVLSACEISGNTFGADANVNCDICTSWCLSFGFLYGYANVWWPKDFTSMRTPSASMTFRDVRLRRLNTSPFGTCDFTWRIKSYSGILFVFFFFFFVAVVFKRNVHGFVPSPPGSARRRRLLVSFSLSLSSSTQNARGTHTQKKTLLFPAAKRASIRRFPSARTRTPRDPDASLSPLCVFHHAFAREEARTGPARSLKSVGFCAFYIEVKSEANFFFLFLWSSI